MTDDGSSVLSVIPVDHVRVGNTHADQGRCRSVEAVLFRAFHRAVPDGSDLFSGIGSVFGIGWIPDSSDRDLHFVCEGRYCYFNL